LQCWGRNPQACACYHWATPPASFIFLWFWGFPSGSDLPLLSLWRMKSESHELVPPFKFTHTFWKYRDAILVHVDSPWAPQGKAFSEVWLPGTLGKTVPRRVRVQSIHNPRKAHKSGFL
jgi:hypothetical protein